MTHEFDQGERVIKPAAPEKLSAELFVLLAYKFFITDFTREPRSPKEEIIITPTPLSKPTIYRRELPFPQRKDPRHP